MRAWARRHEGHLVIGIVASWLLISAGLAVYLWTVDVP